MGPFIQKIAGNLAQETDFTEKAGANGEVFTYAIILLAINLSALGGIVLLAWLLSSLKTTLWIWLAFYSLRVFTGGRHQPGPVQCWLLTVAIFTALGYLVTNLAPQLYHYRLLIATWGLIFTLFVVINYAPVTITSKNFTSEKRKKLKTGAILVIIFWITLLLTPATTTINSDPTIMLGILTGLVTQALSILPPINRKPIGKK